MRMLSYFIVVVAIVGIGFLVFRAPSNETVFSPQSRACSVDSDCMPFISECGECNDYDMAINKDYYSEYLQEYQRECRTKMRICKSVPKGESACINNLCVLK